MSSRKSASDLVDDHLVKLPRVLRDGEQGDSTLRPSLTLDEMTPTTKKVDDITANVDYLLFETGDPDDNLSYSALNRSASMGDILLTSFDKQALKSYAQWNDRTIEQKQCATRILSRLARNNIIKPRMSGYKASLIK